MYSSAGLQNGKDYMFLSTCPLRYRRSFELTIRMRTHLNSLLLALSSGDPSLREGKVVRLTSTYKYYRFS